MEMIDWVTCRMPFFYAGSLNDGQVTSYSRDGTLEYAIDKKMPVVGSHDSRIHIRTIDRDSQGNTTEIEFSGNPVKWLQGHNLFGSTDLPNLMYEVFLRLSDMVGTVQPKSVLGQIQSGWYHVSRVDINRMFSLSNRLDVETFLNHMAHNSRTRSQAASSKASKAQTGIRNIPTVYLQKASKRWNFKMYSKGQEIELARNNKFGNYVISKELKSWADNKLRMELTLRSNELRETGMHFVSKWRNIDISTVFNDYAERIEMSTQKKLLDSSNTIKLASVRATYQLWLDGNDPRTILSTRTYYRHRKALLDHDIDISIIKTKDFQETATIIPLGRVLELKPANLPDSFYSSEYYFKPRKFC